ncbi:MAG: class I SAM-dependent methyltransferase [Verrucomicrobiae bacterium]|nr:class I SAM-dependent methyltransferase [Verrucomicrobiae bacterium]
MAPSLGKKGSYVFQNYDRALSILLPYLNFQSKILDVGCGTGNLIHYLVRKGYDQAVGVDMSAIYVDEAQKKGVPVRRGKAEELPFDNQMFDAVIMEQVLEHVINPARAFKEARRVLKNNGILFVGVPDAARYGDIRFFDFYWLLIREHIQHFDIHHLNALAGYGGFELLQNQRNEHVLLNGKMSMPNLSAIYRSGRCCGLSRLVCKNDLAFRFEKYLAHESGCLSQKREKIKKLEKSGRPVCVWGIGREFLYLYESAGLKNCKITALIDANFHKQKFSKINGMPVAPPSILRTADEDSVLLITATAYVEDIKRAIRNYDFNGKIMTL